MNITTLYAELVVVGTGAMIFILLFLYSCLGDPAWLSKVKELPSLGGGVVVFLIPALSVIYLLGIVMTNLGHLSGEWVEERLRKSKLAGKYDAIRNRLYTLPDTKDLIEDFEFRRSKVRICRGWFLNSLLIITALACCLRSDKIQNSTGRFWITTVALLMVGTAVSWWNATKTELSWLSSFEDGVRARRTETTKK